jgi:glycosyltransferase involved in cell wall biosynthesis
MIAEKTAKKKIAALVPNVLGFSPGQRVRIELWAKHLENAGWIVEFHPYEDDDLHEIFYKKGNILGKGRGLARCYQKQLSLTLNKISADVIFIYREAALIGPALLERIAARQNIPIVFDIDDPVFLPYRSPVNGWASLLKFSKKTHSLFRLSTHVIAINRLIGDYALQYNSNVSVIPNSIDTEKYKPRSTEKVNYSNAGVNLIWIGSHSTMPNLSEIAEPLKKLQAEHKSPLIVVGAGKADLEGVETEMRQWSAETEINDLQSGDIGVLPLNDSLWNNWKFFFKTIQYMAIGIPVVARRMGSNGEVIQDGVNGFLVETMDEWYDRLKLLINNPELRIKMGANARQTVLEKYSLSSQIPRVIEVFESAIENNPKISGAGGRKKGKLF